MDTAVPEPRDIVSTPPLSLTGKRWKRPAVQASLASGFTELPAWLLHFLEQRGISTREAVDNYLEPSLAALADPSTMADMTQAVDRLFAAITNHEPIVVYGDYDVDGVCSTVVLVDYLQQVRANVTFYIPDRKAEGYGLNAEAIRQIAPRTKLLITTDCGITAHHEVLIAREFGCDVIIVDHHQVGETLPRAVAALNPRRLDCTYPFKGLCAAGVAFLFMAGLRRRMRDAACFNVAPEPDLRKLLDVVALATVADMVPMQQFNRILVTAGLRQIKRTERLGLLALLEVAAVTKERITTQDLGFRIGPRINARGRLRHAGDAVRLLLTSDPNEASTLAQALNEANRERQTIEAETVAAAIAQVHTENALQGAALVLYNENWHPGVLGLVASRLASRFHRPTWIIGEGGKGSGRSITGFDLHAATHSASAKLVRFGGHQAAAGLTILPADVAAFRDAFCDIVQQTLGSPPYTATLEPDAELLADAFHLDLVDTVERLAPFGQANPQPVFFAASLHVVGKRIVGDTHLKLQLMDPLVGVVHDGIAFGMGPLSEQIPEQVDVCFHLERNVFRGRTSLQLCVLDIRPASEG